MLALKWRVLSSTIIFLGIGSLVSGQGVLPGSKTIGQRLDNLGKSVDDFGKSVFGPIFGNDEKSKNQSDKVKTIPGPNKKNAGQKADDSPDNPDDPQDSAGQADAVSDRGTPVTVVDSPASQKESPQVPAQPRAATPGSAGASSERVDFGKPSPRPLYERFNLYRKSPFQTTQAQPSPGAVKETVNPVRDSLSADQTRTGPRSDIATNPSPPLFASETVKPELPLKETGGLPTPAKRPAAESDPLGQSVQSTPAKRVAEVPSAAEKQVPAAEGAAPIYTPPVRIESQKSTTPPPSPDAGIMERGVLDQQPPPNLIPPQSISPPVPAPAEENMLIARRGPLLSVETLGPRKITVGKQSVYEVTMINAGDVAAEELLVFISLPPWAEVVGAEASSGAATTALAGQPAGGLPWKIASLAPKTREKLVLRIIPRQSRPFDLAVRWEYKPIASQAMIEVQEPKLEMHLEGPREVYYGKKEIYRLKLSNTGNGAADGVSIKLLPIGAGENVPVVYPLNTLPAGETKTIEVELTARQAGNLSIQVEALGETGVHAELSEKVLVRRGGLDVKVEGPRMQFVGATAAYTVRVRNTGNAPAKNITLQAVLPAAMHYAGGIDAAQSDPAGRIQWRLDALNPEVEQTFLLKCTLGAAGANRLEITATADDELSAAAQTATQVEAVARLELDVKDPGGPVPVGQETAYTIVVRNRGTKDAQNVEVVGYFSRGIEPTRAEGGLNRINPGQVVFSPIPVLAAGSETILKVSAKADTPGNLVFRAEVRCKTLGTRLVNEANTLYYQETANK
jgi:uncharacterized repeat protein (TIGR01451 family)